MLPARELEYRILRFVRDRASGGWQPTNLGTLANGTGAQNFSELMAALKRLHAKGHLELRQLRLGATQYVSYLGSSTNDDFFTRNGFEMKLTPEGYPYLEELEEKGKNARLRPKAYLDNNIVSALARAHLPADTLQAIKKLLELFNQGKLELVTSELSKREIEKLATVPNIDRDKWNLDVVFALLGKVPFIEDHKLLGFDSHWDRSGGWSSPIMEDDTISSELRRLGLDRTDAHHVMIAIRAGCDVFLTFDLRTILNRRAEIERQFPIRLLSPEELAARFV